MPGGNETMKNADTNANRPHRIAANTDTGGTDRTAADVEKELYLRMLEEYQDEAAYNMDHFKEIAIDPPSAYLVFSAELTIGAFLHRHTEISPAEMSDLLPNISRMTEHTEEHENAEQKLFVLDDLHRIIFRPGEVAYPPE